MAIGDGERAVREAEAALQAAQWASDADALDRLLHPALLAVGPDGSLGGKDADLAAHRAGVYAIRGLWQEDLRVLVAGDTAVTFTVVRMEATIAGAEFAGRVRYTRTWVREDGWRVLAAHIAIVDG